MQLNITTDYAIRAVLYLAIKNELTTAGAIASAMGIPKNYILKITQKLVTAGVVKRTVGVHGGFCLAKSTADITLYEIVNLIEPTTRLNRCLEDDKYCSRFATENCPVRNFYCLLQSELDDRLKTITVQQLLQ